MPRTFEHIALSRGGSERTIASTDDNNVDLQATAGHTDPPNLEGEAVQEISYMFANAGLRFIQTADSTVAARYHPFVLDAHSSPEDAAGFEGEMETGVIVDFDISQDLTHEQWRDMFRELGENYKWIEDACRGVGHNSGRYPVDDTASRWITWGCRSLPPNKDGRKHCNVLDLTSLATRKGGSDLNEEVAKELVRVLKTATSIEERDSLLNVVSEFEEGSLPQTSAFLGLRSVKANQGSSVGSINALTSSGT